MIPKQEDKVMKRCEILSQIQSKELTGCPITNRIQKEPNMALSESIKSSRL